MDEAAQAALNELRELALNAANRAAHGDEAAAAAVAGELGREGKEGGEGVAAPAAEPPRLGRHDTPFGVVAGERFQEVGNSYGTPPPPDAPGDDKIEKPVV